MLWGGCPCVGFIGGSKTPIVWFHNCLHAGPATLSEDRAKVPVARSMKQTNRKHPRLVALMNSAMLGSVAATLLLLFSAADGAHLGWRAAVIFGALIGSAVSYFVLGNQHK